MSAIKKRWEGNYKILSLDAQMRRHELKVFAVTPKIEKREGKGGRAGQGDNMKAISCNICGSTRSEIERKRKRESERCRRGRVD